MSEETLDLFIEHEQMMEEIEAKAAELEITVDYYLAEFV